MNNARTGDRRESDMIGRIPHHHGDGTVLVPLEFQSTQGAAHAGLCRPAVATFLPGQPRVPRNLWGSR
jgi:hypothetical protein